MQLYSENNNCTKSVNTVIITPKLTVPLCKEMQIIMDFYTANNELPIDFIKNIITSSFIFDNCDAATNDIWLDILHKMKAWYYLSDPTAILLLLTQTNSQPSNCIFPYVLIDRMRYVPFQSFISVFGRTEPFSLEHCDVQYMLEIEDIEPSFVLKIINAKNKYIKSYNSLLQNSKYINKIIEHIPSNMIDWKVLVNNPYLDCNCIIKNISKFNYQQICLILKGCELEQYKKCWLEYILSTTNSSIPVLPVLPVYFHDGKSEQELETENMTLKLLLQKLNK